MDDCLERHALIWNPFETRLAGECRFTVQKILLLSLFALVGCPHLSKRSSKPWLTGSSYPLQELVHVMKSSKKLTRTSNGYKDQLVGGTREFMPLREGGAEMPHEAG